MVEVQSKEQEAREASDTRTTPTFYTLVPAYYLGKYLEIRSKVPAYTARSLVIFHSVRYRSKVSNRMCLASHPTMLRCASCKWDLVT